MSRMSRLGALFTLSSFLSGGSCLRQPGINMGSGNPDRAELVEVARTAVCSTTSAATTSGSFTISFDMTLENAAGTQCVWCEDDAAASDTISSSSKDRLVLEGGRLKLHMNEATPQETVFAPIFRNNEAYTVAIVYNNDGFILLFMDNEVVQAKEIAFSTNPSFEAGHFGCFKTTTAATADENRLLVLGTSTPAFELVDTVSQSDALWTAYETQKTLAENAATEFVAVATAVEGTAVDSNFAVLNQSVSDEKALLTKLVSCKDSTIETYRTYTSSSAEVIEMTNFSCSTLPASGELDCQTKLDNFIQYGNNMMTELQTQYGNCDTGELVAQNTQTNALLEDFNKGRCDMGRQFLVMHSDATYIGAAKAMTTNIESVTNLLSFSTTTAGYPEVTFNNPSWSIPQLDAANFAWPAESEYTFETASSKISVWNVEDNAFIDLVNC